MSIASFFKNLFKASANDESFDVGKYVNHGHYVLNDENAGLEVQKTVVVVGLARSGTSMVAHTLSHLGVFMGNSDVTAPLEDKKIFTALESPEGTEDFKKIVHKNNSLHDNWGWKRPGIERFNTTYEPLVRNLHYIFIFRDIASVALRKTLSASKDYKEAMKETVNHNVALVHFLEQTNYPSLIISNEKALINKSVFIDEIIQFLKLEVDSTQRSSAIESIKINKPDYLKQTITGQD